MNKFFVFISLIMLSSLLSSCTLFTCSLGNRDVIVKEFNYNGHTYLRFKPKFSYGCTVLHSPNCKCHDKQLQENKGY